MSYWIAGKLGWLCAMTLLSLSSLFVLRRLNKTVFKENKITKSVERGLAKFHPYGGYLLVIAGITHGYMELQRIDFHTGYILWGTIVVMLLINQIGKRFKFRGWVKIHRYFDVAVVAAFIVHMVLKDRM